MEKKFNDVEKAIKEKLELEPIPKPVESFQCDKCSLSSSSEHGLKTHMRKKHKAQKEFQESNSSQQCNFCDVVFSDERQMKKHMRTHSYSLVQYKCDLCELMGNDEIDMDVHAAKLHGDKFECGLCEHEAKDNEDLEIHLSTCEYYKSEECSEQIWKLTSIKEHFLSKHWNSDCYGQGVWNKKPSRENSEIYDQKFHKLRELFPELKK